MKKLTIKTVRRFRNDGDWEEYKKVSPVQVDWDELEDGKIQIFTTHQVGEEVQTILELEDF